MGAAGVGFGAAGVGGVGVADCVAGVRSCAAFRSCVPPAGVAPVLLLVWAAALVLPVLLPVLVPPLATGFACGAFAVWPGRGDLATGPTGFGNGPGGAGPGLLEGGAPGGGPGGSVALAGALPGGGAGGPSAAGPVALGPTSPHRDGWRGGEFGSTGCGMSTEIGAATGCQPFLPQIQCCPCQ